jgi:hypothetical protein
MRKPLGSVPITVLRVGFLAFMVDLVIVIVIACSCRARFSCSISFDGVAADSSLSSFPILNPAAFSGQYVRRCLRHRVDQNQAPSLRFCAPFFPATGSKIDLLQLCNTDAETSIVGLRWCTMASERSRSAVINTYWHNGNYSVRASSISFPHTGS